MSVRVRAAIHAAIATGVWALLMLVPLVSVISLIAFMFPLWILNDLGVPGLGRELNGFFVPSAVGWCLIAGFVWLALFWLLLRRLKRKEEAGNVAGH